MGDEARECVWGTVRSQGRQWERASGHQESGHRGKRNGANMRGFGELRKEPRERARGWGTTAGYGRIQDGIREWRSKGYGCWEELRRKNKDWKTTAGYARRRRESGGGRETEVMLEGFRMRNGFRERLVMKLTQRVYHWRKAGGRVCLGQELGCDRLWLKGIRRTAAWERGL